MRSDSYARMVPERCGMQSPRCRAAFAVVQLLSPVWFSAIPLYNCGTPVFTISQNLLKLMSIESMMPSNPLILCRPLLLLPSVFASIRVFSNESTLHIRWPNYWSFSISPSNEYSGLISCRIDWFDLLAVQETLKSLLQHHSSKASVLWCLAFFMIKLSHPYMTTGKTIALTIWTFVGKVMSVLFNMLSTFVEIGQFYEDRQDLLEVTHTKSCPFHHRGLECKSRKSRDTWSNRQVWPWSTKWSRGKG